MDTPELLPTSDQEVRDLEILIRANHPFILVETEEPERGEMLIRWVADRLALPYARWTADEGLRRSDVPAFRAPGSEDLHVCLDYIDDTHCEWLYHIDGFHQEHLQDLRVLHKLSEIAPKLFKHRGAMLVCSFGLEVPVELARLVTRLRLASPSRAQHELYVKQVLRDLHQRTPVEVKLSAEDLSRLLNQLAGLTFFEVKKILTKLFVEDHGFDSESVGRVAEAKREIIERSGVLEYFTPEESIADVAGVARLKDWLRKRKAVFSEPERARRFGLSAPKGVLLLGVQGCGKSMCAKAIAHAWGLPLIRLDPSNLYNKYFGESEKNLKRAMRTAEAMAPIVLWMDELEKAFGLGEAGADDSATSQRIFGTFLSWMQDKRDGVFVVATCNDIESLPPELLRKGRFDEIFFVDLPSVTVRQEILAVHLRRRGRDPSTFSLAALAEATPGFSGAELEQIVVSALYSAFARGIELSDACLHEEIARTMPLCVTAGEKVQALRAWAQGRTVPAE
ncbi:MAG TPA: AAA family ATPase [Polyangiales bacterium]|nr:AAA family ATPase [Polyangiales bacterium]